MPALTTTSRLTGRVKCLCWCLSAFFFSMAGQGCTTKETPQSADPFESDYLYQYSIISALQAGVFDGNLTLGEVKKHGNFGLGTFNRVDGELVFHEGKPYRIRSNGTVSEVADRDSTSLAFVKFFKADSSFTIQTAGLTMEQVQKKIAVALPVNEIYAIRIKGTFSKMTTRAPAPAQKPYPTLNDHLARAQVIFNLTNTSGVATGFLIPAYMEKVNVPGFHFHYLSDDLKSGGHVYDYTATQITVEIDRTKGYYVELNTNADFGRVTL